MYIKSFRDVIYIKQLLKFQLVKTGKERYNLDVTYVTDYELMDELTNSILEDVSKDSVDIILSAIEYSDDLEKLCVDIGRK